MIAKILSSRMSSPYTITVIAGDAGRGTRRARKVTAENEKFVMMLLVDESGIRCLLYYFYYYEYTT